MVVSVVFGWCLTGCARCCLPQGMQGELWAAESLSGKADASTAGGRADAVAAGQEQPAADEKQLHPKQQLDPKQLDPTSAASLLVPGGLANSPFVSALTVHTSTITVPCQLFVRKMAPGAAGAVQQTLAPLLAW